MIPINEQPYPLPKGWQWIFWGKCGTFVAGSAFKKEYQGLKNKEIPFYKVGSLKFTSGAGYLFDESDTISEEIRKTLKAKLIPPNSLHFAKIGEAIKLNRRALNNVPCCIDNNLIAFISEKILFRYAYYWSFTINLYEYTNATTVPAIRKSDLEKIPIPLPPLDEQQRIVDLLDELFADLDEAKTLAQGVADGSELRRAAILHRAFSGELTKLWREEHGITLDSWQQVQLGEVLVTLKQKINDFNADLKYVGLENMERNGGKISFQAADEVKSTKNIFHAGNLLYGKLRPYLDKHGVARFDGVCSTDILVFSANDKSLNEFINYFFSLPNFIEYAVANSKGINLPRVSEKIVLNAEILLPPLEEQKEIVRLLDDLLGHEQRTEELATKTLERVELMKKSILARAFRGKFKTNA